MSDKWVEEFHWTLDKEQASLRKYYANSIGDDIPSVSARKKAEK